MGGERHAVRGCDADGGGAPHLHHLDGVRHVFDAATGDERGLVRQACLIDQDERALARVPFESAHRLAGSVAAWIVRPSSLT